MKNLMVVLAALFMSFSVVAGENDHPMSKITGKGISLFTKDHAIAGRIGKKIIFGDVSSAKGHKSSTIKVKTDHGTFETTFTNRNGEWGGVLNNGRTSAKVKFVSLDRDNSTYKVSIKGKEYTVKVDAEDFRNNHFIKPTYTLELPNGKEVSAKMHEGQACYMFSLHLIFMIFGTYLF